MSRGEADGRAGPRLSGEFGPFQALTALTDAQRRGLDAATQVVRGFADLLDTQPSPSTQPSPGTQPSPDMQPPDMQPSPDSADDRGPANGHEPGLAQLRVTVARALDLYADLVRRSFEGYADLMDQMLRSRGVQLDSADGGLLTLQGAAGARATGTVWMHNTTAQQASAIPRLTDLASHDGLLVPASAGRFQPEVLTIEPSASTSATVEVNLGDVAPGVYRGHVLARGLPDVALPIRLLVRAETGRS
jgi:hypothetical protein